MTINKKLKYYAKKLNQDAPEGEFLAYINKKESNLLKRKGGLGIKTRSGIPSYIGSDASGQGGGSTGGGPGDASDSDGKGKGGGGGGKSKGPTARDKHMGALGKTGVEDKSLDSGGPGVDRSKVSQFSTYGINRFNQTLKGPTIGSRISSLISPKNIFTGLLGLVNPAFGLLSKAFANIDIQGLRGYNPDGTPKTQEQYEQDRLDKQLQGRLDKMYDRKTLGKNFSQTNMDRLEAMGLAPSTAQNVLTGRDLNLRGILNSRALTGVPTGVAPMGVNVPSGIQSIDVGYPENNLMAGLTKMQQKMLAGPQRNLKNIMGITDQEILDNISPFNDPSDPATLEEVQSFYTT